MPAPSVVAASGYFRANRAGVPFGEAILAMSTALKGTLTLGGSKYTVTGDAANKQLSGTASGAALSLTIKTNDFLTGTLGGNALELTREVLSPIPSSEMGQSDPGPSGHMKAVLESTPDYRAQVGDAHAFWYAFGPVLYRGRLDGSARVLGIASDPGPTECLPFVRRTLVGDSGQKTQGLLAKLGLTRSYALVNAFAVALHPSQKAKGLQVLRTNAVIAAARHTLYDGIAAGGLQAIMAFGDVAHDAYDLWVAAHPGIGSIPFFKVAHPAAVDRDGSGHDAPLIAWGHAVSALRGVVTPDPDGDPSGANYGDYLIETDYARIPRWDLPAVAPAYVGDDSWGRAAHPRHNNCCERPTPDDGVSLQLTPPAGQGKPLRYEYAGGRLAGAKDSSGVPVAVDANGIPT